MLPSLVAEYQTLVPAVSQSCRRRRTFLDPVALRERLANTPDVKYLSFVAAWELQSQIATVVLVALVALASLSITLGVMIAWSLLATVVYFVARRRGLPTSSRSAVLVWRA